MYRKLIVILLALGSATVTWAQQYWDSSRPNQRLTIGVRAGMNFSKQNNQGDGADNDFRTGFQAGVAADVNIVRSFSVNTGVMYIQKGYKSEYVDYLGSLKTTDNAAYVEVPVLASYRIELSDAAHFQLNLGPYFAFGIAGDKEVKSTFAAQGDTKVSSFDEYDGMKKFDMGLSIGAGLTFSKVFVGLNYERSLQNVSNQTGKKFQNGTIAFTVGYNL